VHKNKANDWKVLVMKVVVGEWGHGGLKMAVKE